MARPVTTSGRVMILDMRTVSCVLFKCDDDEPDIEDGGRATHRFEAGERLEVGIAPGCSFAIARDRGLDGDGLSPQFSRAPVALD